jgi:APA family basic amino acid/polyamine antiporter
VFAAFSNRRLSSVTGWAIVLTGLVSAATLANGFVGYFQEFISLPDALIIIGIIVSMGLLAAWGIQQSMTVAVVITLLEIIGLLIIIGVSAEHLTSLPERLTQLLPQSNLSSWSGIMAGSFLAFYAFIGFEDMVNVAEEVKPPSVTIPIAIGLAMLLATILYFVVSVTAVISMPLDQLADSDAPFADLMQLQGYSPTLISMISLVAIINGALVQVIMASRVIYGMADQGNAPAWKAEIHPLSRTPVNATALVTLMILILALALPLVALAKAASFIVLLVFAFINLSLLRIKINNPATTEIYTCWPDTVWLRNHS